MGIQPHDSEPFIPAALPTCPQWCEGGHGREDCGAEADGLHHFCAGPEIRLHDVVNPLSGRIRRRGGHSINIDLRQVDDWSGLGSGLPTISMLVYSPVHEAGYDHVDLPLTAGEADPSPVR